MWHSKEHLRLRAQKHLQWGLLHVEEFIDGEDVFLNQPAGLGKCKLCGMTMSSNK